MECNTLCSAACDEGTCPAFDAGLALLGRTGIIYALARV